MARRSAAPLLCECRGLRGASRKFQCRQVPLTPALSPRGEREASDSERVRGKRAAFFGGRS